MRCWHVVHTHANAEWKALANLRRQGFEAYLPRYRKFRRHARKTEVVAAPLFPRYLFLRLDAGKERWRSVLSTFGVAALICRDGAPAPIPDGIVEGIQAREDADAFIDLTRQAELKPGDAVRVMSGTFADHAARFLGLAARERVVLLLDILGRSLRIEVPRESVTASA